MPPATTGADARDQQAGCGAHDSAKHHAGAGSFGGELARLVAFPMGRASLVLPRVSDLVVLDAALV
jgi:hypothetical protein